MNLELRLKNIMVTYLMLKIGVTRVASHSMGNSYSHNSVFLDSFILEV